MSSVDVAVGAVHLLVAGVWTGSVLFVTVGLLPAAKSGNLNARPLGLVAERLRWISRTATVLMLVTGGHLAAQGYTLVSLTGTVRGYGVLAMVSLWVMMTGLVEVAGGRLVAGTDADKVRDPSRAASPYLVGATVIGVVLLLLGGVLTAV